MLIIPSFLISSPSLKFTIFLYLSPIGHFDIADPSSMQDACHHELSIYDLCSPRVSKQLSGWSVRPVYGRSWVRFPSGTQIFSLSYASDMLIIPSFLISSPSLKFTIFLYLSPIGHFEIADPNSMQDVCHHELSKYDLRSPRVSK